MHRAAQFVLASLFAVTISSLANANIVLTAVRDPAQLPINPNVTMFLYATYDSIPTPGLPLQSDQVTAYRFRVNITGAVTGLTASHELGLGSAWSGVTPEGILPSGSPFINTGAQTVSFQANNQAPISSATIGTTVGASTKIATISFVGTVMNSYTLTFTPEQNTLYTGIAGFGYVDPGTSAQTQHTPGNNFIGNAVTIVVVPEPSTFALCGLASVVGLWRARRKR